MNRFARYGWVVLGYNVLVVLWGALVRATGSGAGCGAHWPLCNGEVVPLNPQAQTMIEFSHRMSSGIALLLVIGLGIWAFRAFPPGHLVRRGAVWSVVLIFFEALIGAGLVLFELVAHNTSTTRVVSISLHLVNTFLLLGALTLTAWWATTGAPFRFDRRRPLAMGLLLGVLGTVLIGASGAIVALGDTLFPAESLAAGLRQDVDAGAHYLVRLRLVHPALAVGVGFGLMLLATACARQAPTTDVTRWAKALRGLVMVQWVAGVVNVALLAPVWMQLLHLFLADLLWISLVLMAAAVLSTAEADEATVATGPRVALPPRGVR